MRIRVWSVRVMKEILRDPITIIFGAGFPVVLLFLLSAIQSNIPVELFAIESLTPGIAVFGLSFLALFAAQLVAKDRSGRMLARMFTTPMRSRDFILGYTLPLFPLALLQGVICCLTAIPLGLAPTLHTLSALLGLLPIAAIYIGIGLIGGCLLSEKAATVLCGTILTNLSAFLSGIWFSLDMVGEAFCMLAELLPFTHAVELVRALLSGGYGDVFPHIFFVFGYAFVLLLVAVFAFRHCMKDV